MPFNINILQRIKNLSSKQLILIGIITLAALLRLWNLGNVPPSASMDEASIGYNAYSVLKTGGDEYGEFPFISQRSYDDWRRSTYLLLVVPFVAIFDLNVIAVRLPAALMSILSVWATYYIATYLFSKKSSYSSTIPLLTTFLLAIAPWHVYISRLGHETNAYLSFFIFGVFFFLRGEKKVNWKLIFISMIFFMLSMISYYAGQVFIPVFVFCMLLIYRNTLIKMFMQDKKALIPFIGLFAILIPILFIIFSPTSLVRFKGTSTFNPEAHMDIYKKNVELRNKAVERGDIIGTIIYNRRWFPLEVFSQGYLAHFNPDWLFQNHSSDSHKVPNLGLLYSWQLPLLLIGMVVLLFSPKIDKRSKILVILWILLSPLPGSIATQAPHAMRTYNFLPSWQIITALGLVFMFYALKQLRYVGLFFFIIVICISLQSLYTNYFVVFPHEQSKSFHYAFSKTMPYILANQGKYDSIIFSNQDNLYQSYMVYLYYSKYDPFLYQKQGGTKTGGYNEPHKFGKLEFRPIKWAKEKKGNILYVGNPGEVLTKDPLYTGYYLNNVAGVFVQEKK